MTGSQLLTTIGYSEKFGRQAFLIRGACVYRFLKETALRLPGGRGKRDQERRGKRARLEDLAAHTGVHRRTLETDARIYQNFFLDRSQETKGACTPCLPREIYAISLNAPDPNLAINEAYKRLTDKSYGREEFREYVRELKRTYDAKQQHDQGQPPLPMAKVKVPKNLLPVLAELESWSGKDYGELIAEAIQKLHKSYVKRRLRTVHSPSNNLAASATQHSLVF
jgi:hypothetical protein